jgi:hypothetical protein
LWYFFLQKLVILGHFKTQNIGHYWLFFPSLWLSKVAIIHKEDLAKFGYKLQMNVKKFKHPCIFFTNCKNLP